MNLITVYLIIQTFLLVFPGWLGYFVKPLIVWFPTFVIIIYYIINYLYNNRKGRRR